MINNDIVRRLRKTYDLDDTQTKAIFAHTQLNLNDEQFANLFKQNSEDGYAQMTDLELAHFLNGFIIEKRGKKEGAQPEMETQLSNNAILNKIKIALELKAEDTIEIFKSAEVTLTKYELSAFFRNNQHKHFKPCSDDVLSAFLRGLKNTFAK
ncbi:DUF1456 family protein [Marinicellulosiphila megalodicopiae]|uniref:DUF1456 family protein n=1 Tax=Marinicellulosiphila megalodicopiae TaxID=2724896 RepID=UPI003BAF6B08